MHQHEIIFGVGILASLCFLVFILCRYFFGSAKEKKEIVRLFDEALKELNSQNRFIRTSTFKKICEDLTKLRHSSFLSKKAILRSLLQLQDSRNQKNQMYRQKEVDFATALFKDANGKSTLNEEQLAAVVSDEDSNLIIAGAGSGKTTVIAHKVKYLVERGTNPEEILLLSFTKASAKSLKERIQNSMDINVEATTLHSFAYATIKKSTKTPPTLADEKEFYSKVYESLLKTLSKSNYLRLFLEFYGKHYYDIKPLVYYKNISDLRIDLKKAGTQLAGKKAYLEEIELRKRLSTLKGELVRSIDERYIADFLYIHGIKYEYEKRYELASYPYDPDFYLIDYDIYLEHFAFDKEGKAPSWFDNPKKYVEDAQIKRDLHKKMGTMLIETHSGYLSDEGSDEYLAKTLKAAGVETKNINTSVVEHISRKFNQFIHAFYTRQKLSGKTLSELKSTFLDTPYKVFFSFYDGFADEFDKVKKTEQLSDFTDLLLETTDIYRQGNESGYKYIIVDEFQDTSWVSMQLLDAVYEASPQASFFMVGDDWQSIYGFNGTDVSILMQFQGRPGCEIKYLNKNYRSHRNIVELGKRFIECNEKQIKKSVVSANLIHNDSQVRFIYFHELEEQIRSIGKKESIFLVGRFNDDEPIKLISDLRYDGYRNIEFKTIHKSKGLEATHVFILFPNESTRDFPSFIQDHYIYNILKRNTETFPFAEERRLMYVAITRAEKNVYFVSPFKDKMPSSDFWAELESIVSEIITARR
jgi:DNA helicase-4